MEVKGEGVAGKDVMAIVGMARKLMTMADALAVWELPALAVPAYAVADAEMFEPSSPDVTVCEAGQLAVAPGASGSGLQEIGRAHV